MRMSLAVAIPVLLSAPLLAGIAATAPEAKNPFLGEWTTPFGAPPFDQIREEHYLPAFEEAIARTRTEVKAVAANEEAPTFANTIEALEHAGLLLGKVRGVFFAVLEAQTSETLQQAAQDVAPKLSALADDILLDQALFKRVKTVWEGRAELKLSSEQNRLLEKTYQRFVRGGANLEGEKQERLRAINSELASLSLTFSDNLLKETNAYKLVVDTQEDLSGLPGGAIQAAAETAKAAGLDGKWVFTLQAPSIWPFLSYADNRELRRAILTAYTTRGDHGNQQDNKLLLVKIASLRAEKATLLGFATWADFVLQESMAGTPKRVYALLDQLWKPALAVAKQEAQALQAQIKEDGHDFKLEPWDWRYYTEKVRKARFDLDEEALRPYFQLDKVREGAFQVANRLWGITFTEVKGIPVYHPEVRAYEVKGADDAHIGLLYVDYHPRDSKRGGAWMDNFRQQRVENGSDVRPIVYNVGNFSRPTADTPSLLTLEEVTTLYHEFGHALHGLLSRCHYSSLSGANVYRDFVELPSQILENWALDREVIKGYAKHWKTGEVIPEELLAKIEAAKKFNQGFISTEYLAASYLDMDWHTVSGGQKLDATSFERASLERIGLIPEIVVRYRSTYFNHIFGGGYSAGYYSYIWAEVLDADAFQAFKEKGIFDQATARSFRTNILERGDSADPMVLFKRFRGREPEVKPLLVKRGLD